MFNCAVFNGCSSSEKEIFEFLNTSIGHQLIETTHSVEYWFDDNHNGKCMLGVSGEKICVRQLFGKFWIQLIRDQYGRPSMTLSLN